MYILKVTDRKNKVTETAYYDKKAVESAAKSMRAIGLKCKIREA